MVSPHCSVCQSGGALYKAPPGWCFLKKKHHPGGAFYEAPPDWQTEQCGLTNWLTYLMHDLFNDWMIMTEWLTMTERLTMTEWLTKYMNA